MNPPPPPGATPEEVAELAVPSPTAWRTLHQNGWGVGLVVLQFLNCLLAWPSAWPFVLPSGIVCTVASVAYLHRADRRRWARRRARVLRQIACRREEESEPA